MTVLLLQPFEGITILNNSLDWGSLDMKPCRTFMVSFAKAWNLSSLTHLFWSRFHLILFAFVCVCEVSTVASAHEQFKLNEIGLLLGRTNLFCRSQEISLPSLSDLVLFYFQHLSFDSSIAIWLTTHTI